MNLKVVKQDENKIEETPKKIDPNILRKKIEEMRNVIAVQEKNSNIVVERYKKAIDIKIIAIMVPTE